MAPYQINIKCTNGDKFVVPVELASDVALFKEAVAEVTNVPAALQRLIFKGHVLKDNRTLESYNIENENTIILVRGTAQRTGASTASAPTTTTTNPSSASSSSSATSMAPQPSLSSMASMANSMGGMNMNAIQQQMAQNPELMSQLMNSPMIQGLLDNPDMIQNMFQNNPQLTAILESNPELAHILNDPETIRQSMQMARNPELMREMMRNTDRAMSNVEAHPEGFNAMRRMYENIQEPMMNAAQDAAQQGSSSSSSSNAANTFTGPLASGQQPSNEPLPNPWATSIPQQSQTNSRNANNDASQAANGAAFNPAMLAAIMGIQQPQSSQQQQQQQQQAQDPMGAMNMNPEAMQQLLQSPMMRTMMTQMANNPEVLQQARNGLQNPLFQQAMANPQLLQAALQMQGNAPLRSQNPSATSTTPSSSSSSTQPNVGTQPSSDALAQLMASFQANFGGAQSAFNAHNAPATQTAPTQPPEVMFQTQIVQLNEMGFTDPTANIRALLQTGGNVQAAIEVLLNSV